MAISFMHNEMLVVHGNIKLENILLCTDNCCAQNTNSKSKSAALKLKIGEVFNSEKIQLSLKSRESLIFDKN